MHEDLLLISGEFITADFPADKAWLSKYFRRKVVKRFIIYCLTFRELTKRVSLRYYCKLFVDHTGCYCSKSVLCQANKKLRELEAIVEKAEKDKDFETLIKVKHGCGI